jgi:outer membrane protein assembly factor BamB
MKNVKRTTAALAIFVLIVSAHRAGAQDWPQWRGPNRDAKVTGFNPPKAWPKELAQKWKVTVGDGVATPALVGDKLYVFAREDGNEVIRCLDASTGKDVWQDKYEAKAASGPAARFAGPRSSPAVAEGKVVTLGVDGVLSCLDAATGKVLWRKNDFKGTLPQFFTSSSPILVNGVCIVQLGGERSGAVVAYDLATGNEKWRWTGDGTAYASPVLLAVGDTKAIVAETAAKIVAVGITDGKLLWETPFPKSTQGRSYNACTPMVEGQTVIYSGSGGRGTKAVKIEKQGDMVAAKELWTNKENGVQFNTPVLKNGLLFGISEGNTLFCINAETGKTAWTAPVTPSTAGGQPPAGQPGGGQGGRGGRGGRMGGGGGYGSIVDAGPVLLALTPSSELIVFQPIDKAYTELARIKVAKTPTYAYPVVAGNRVFIKDQDSVTLWTIE